MSSSGVNLLTDLFWSDEESEMPGTHLRPIQWLMGNVTSQQCDEYSHNYVIFFPFFFTRFTFYFYQFTNSLSGDAIKS